MNTFKTFSNFYQNSKHKNSKKAYPKLSNNKTSIYCTLFWVSIVQVYFLNQEQHKANFTSMYFLYAKKKKKLNQRTPKLIKTVICPNFCKIRRNTSNLYQLLTPQTCSNNPTLKKLFLFSRI